MTITLYCNRKNTAVQKFTIDYHKIKNLHWTFKSLSSFSALERKRILNVFFVRIGTCGGIGLPPGTVVVTDEAFDGLLRPVLDTVSSLFGFVFCSAC
jgi:hypothetical protein